jgi:TolB-like protein
MQRVFSDSMKAALAQMQSQIARGTAQERAQPSPQNFSMYTPIVAPPTDGKPRVVVLAYTNGTGRRELGMFGRNIADSLRAALGTNNAIGVLDLETTARAGRGGGSDFMSVGWMLRADYVITGTYFLRGDSLIMMTTFNDVRRGRFNRTSETAALANEPDNALPPAVMHINSWIDSAAVSRETRGGRGGRGPEVSNFSTAPNSRRVPPTPPESLLPAKHNNF